MMEGFFPAGWDLAKIDRLAAVPPEQTTRGKLVASAFRAGRLRPFADFDTYMGHEIAREIQLAPPGRPADRLHPAGRADGHVSLDGIFPQRMGRLLRPRPRLQHGRMVRRPGKHAAARNPGAFQHAMEQAFYGPLGKPPCRRGSGTSR